MNDTKRVLIVDDQIGDLDWLVDRLQAAGSEVVVAPTEWVANQRIDALASGEEHYDLVILDVMIAVVDLDTLLDDPSIDAEALDEAESTGIRLAQRLRALPTKVPIVCCTVRGDDEVRAAMDELGIPVLGRDDVRGLHGVVEEYVGAWD